MYKKSTSILTSSDASQWRDVLEQTKPYDFYHLPEFHRLAEINGEGEAIMYVFAEKNHIIAFPMLLRDLHIPGKSYRDAGSVHGYAGPLASSEDIPEEVRKHFLGCLADFYTQHNIISAFSRLHPFADQSAIMQGYGEIVEIGATISMDLTIPPEEQLSHYRRNHRQDLNRLRNMGYTCREVGPEYLDEFVRIYLNAMENVNADSMYYYSNAYFTYMLNEMNDSVHLFACELKKSVASVALCAVCNNIIQVHLAGTDIEHRKYAPMKLVFDTIRQWGNKIGADIVHLGGGVGAKRDTLYNFKKGFGSQEHIYYTWQNVIDTKVYAQLCADALGAEADPNTSYFPKYRILPSSIHENSKCELEAVDARL